MKLLKQKIGRKLLSFLLTLAMVIGLMPGMGLTAYAEGTDKTVSGLGTSAIGNPTSTTTEATAWAGSYVYYGKYDGTTPTKYRVLDKASADFGVSGGSLLLDCNTVLYSTAFGSSYAWASSSLRSGLQGDAFLSKEGVFTDQEKAAIAESTKSEAVTEDGSSAPNNIGYYSYVALDNDTVFVLDAKEVSRASYGYASSGTRKKNGEARNRWWLRSVYTPKSNKEGSSVSEYGGLYDYTLSGSWGVCPAFNVSLSSVIFSSEIPDESGSYKLTLKDDALGIAVTSGKKANLNNNQLTIPYTVSGDNSANATQVSVLVTDKAYTESDVTILKYGKLADVTSDSLSGRAYFILPEGLEGTLGTNYHVYLLAEDVNGEKETDYANLKEITADDISTGPDKTALNEAITAAETLYNSIKEKDPGAAAALLEAINAAKSVKSNAEATKEAVENAAAAIADAKVVAETVVAINALPTFSNVTADNKADIEAARTAYNALTTEQKNGVSAETLKKLTDAEDKLVILQTMSEVSAKTGSGMTYTGNPIQLINTPTTKLPAGYKMVYAVTTENTAPTDDNLYTTSIPTATDAGTYYVWYKVVGDENHNDTKPVCVTVLINEKKITPIKHTIEDRSISYTGQPQELVIKGEADGGTMVYAIGTDDTTVPTEGWSEDIPTGTNPGTYYVWYKVKGDESHFDSDPVCVIVTITGLTVDAKTDMKPLAEGKTTSVDTSTNPDAGESLANEAKAWATENSADVKLYLSVAPKGQSKATESEVLNNDESMHSKVQSQFKDENSVSVDVLDIYIKQTIKGESSDLKETKNVLEIGIGYDFTGKYDPVVVRKHGETAEVFKALSSRPAADPYEDARFYADTANNKLYIYSNKFSEYVIAYSTEPGNAQNRTASTGGSSSSSGAYPTTIPVYRLFNTATGQHFYTANKQERDLILEKNAADGWTDEGIAFETAQKTSIPVYRVFDMVNGNHIFTIDAAARDLYIANGYRDEGIAWYAPATVGRKVYKLTDAKSNKVTYTTSKAEADMLIEAGFTCEDAEFVVY